MKYRLTGSNTNVRGIRYRYRFKRVETNEIWARGDGTLAEIKANEWSYKSIQIEKGILRNDWKGYIFEFDLETSRYDDPNVRDNKCSQIILFDF